jgi:enoyl-CoA hydratase
MQELITSMSEGILTLTLNRPEKLNALSEHLLHALLEQINIAKQEANIKAVLLTGQGEKAFCAGADIRRLAECNAEQGYAFACFGQHVFRQLETLGKPSVAAINGYAFGGGCELAMATTLRLASTNAQFGQPEVKLGVIPGYGGTQRLTRLIGKGRALDLCLTGRFIDAQTALHWGLVNDVIEPHQLIERARALLKQITAMGPIAVTSIMNAIDHGADLSLTEALHLEALHFSKTCASADKQEGVQAFLEKRLPIFRGA